MKNSTAWMTLAVAAVAAACSSTNDDDGSRPPDTAPSAVATFLGDFHASRYSKAGADALALDDAASAAPDAGPIALDRGLAHLWHVSEAGRDPHADPSAIQRESATLPALFQNAKTKNPDDTRVDCFLGLMMLNAARATNDATLLQQGYAVVDRGVASFPEFNLFCKGLAYQDQPASTPDYAKAVDAAWQTLDVCFGETVDRANPDITKYLDQATDKGPKRVCWNDALAPHNAEGFYLWMGDVLVKNGNVPAARVIYGNAKLVKEYPSWPYQSLLGDRLNADLSAKAALYKDSDPSNDPPLGGATAARPCAYCHAATADE